MRCAVSFLTVIILSIAVGVMALYIIWITENEDDCEEPNFRCLSNGKCIKLKPKDVCNKVVDCPDGSDEAPIYCNDLTTTNEMLNIMAECKNSTYPLDNDTTVVEWPEGCSYLGVNESMAIGIKCYLFQMNGSWSQIPWHEFDESARTISIDNGALNTTVLLGQTELLDNNGTTTSGERIMTVPTNNSMSREFPLLNKLYIDKNYIESVEASAFCHMDNVCWLSLTGNGIRNLSPDAFCPMMKLRMLKMSENKLHLTGFQFRNMSLLGILNLDYNEISEISDGMFSQLANLTMLNISHNRIKAIHENAFQHNMNLIELDLTANLLSFLSPSVFQSQLNLTKLYISSNPHLFLPSTVFAPLSNLRSLNIQSLDISQIDFNSFNFTRKLDLVYFKKFSYCRFVPNARRCYPHSDGLSSTSNLLIGQSRIMVWLVGLLTVLGNISVLANRWCRRRSTGRTEITDILNIFVTNLALADFLMGVYLLILACKDVQFRGMYSVKAYEWGTSWLCSFVGIIAMISSEVSLLILTIMSLERYLTIGGPFSERRNLNTNLAKASMLIIWAFVCALALAPALQWRGGSTAFYGSTGLCFPIHLDERYPVGWQYTTFVFIGVNSCCLVLITVSYSMLFYTVRKTQRRTPLLVKNIELASRFFLMVVTDVLCWAPIIILKGAVLCGHELSKEIIGWAVIYMLPINSAVNPILYTFSTNEVRHAMTAQIDRLIANFELNQLIPSQNHANIIELQGLNIRAWFSRLVPRRESANQGSTNPVPTGTTEDSELTHSICPTIMTTDNSCAIGGGIGCGSGGAGGPVNNCSCNHCQKNYYNNASRNNSHPTISSKILDSVVGDSTGSSNNLNVDKNIKPCNRLSPSSAAATVEDKINSSCPSKPRRPNNLRK